jgi:CrcB protein
VEPDHITEGRSGRKRGRAPLLGAFDRRELVAIFAGGFVGALARASLVQGFPERPDRWPWVTFAVNIAGAFLLGFLATRMQERLPLSVYSRSLLGTGLCGALTTFSTMTLELLRMIDGGHWALTAGYASASIGCGLVAVFVSTKVVRRAGLRA